MATARCLQCGSERIRRSRRRSPIERAIAILGASLRRCHECNARFVQIGASLIRLQDLRRASKYTMFAVAMAIAAVLVLAVVMWFSRAQSNPSSDSAALRVRTGVLCRRILDL